MMHVDPIEGSRDVVARIFRLNLPLATETLTAAATEIEALGLEAKDFFVLDWLEERPYPAELARHLSIPHSTLTLHLKNLEAKGSIVRRSMPKICVNIALN